MIRIVATASTLDNGKPTSRGGWAIVSASDDYSLEVAARVAGPVTCMQTELVSVLEAIRHAPSSETCTVYTDCQYAANGFARLPTWVRNGFRGADGKVKNQEVWKAILEEAAEKPLLSVVWLQKNGGDDHLLASHELARGMARAAARLASEDQTLHMPSPAEVRAKSHLRVVATSENDDEPIF